MGPAAPKQGGFFRKHRKKLLIGGAAGGVAAMLVSGFFALLTFKLVHLRQVITNYFDGRQAHSIQTRVGRHWQLVLDPDGEVKGYRKNVFGHPISNGIYNFKTNKLVADLGKKGFKADFNSNGKLVGFTGTNGTKLDFTEEKLKSRRSATRLELKETYPEMGFFRRNLRARRMFRFMGIRFRLFENTREKIADKEADISKKLKEKMRRNIAGESSGSLGVVGASESTDETARQQDIATGQQFGDDINAAGEIERQKILGDANYKPPDPANAAKLAREGLEGGAKGGVKGFFLGAINTLGNLCTVKSLLNSVSTGAKFLRAAPLARYAGQIIGSADDMKKGKVNGRELNVLMKSLNGFEKSGGWQRITGSNPNATIKTGDKFKMDGGFTGDLLTLDREINDKVPSKTACKVVGNPFVQIGGAIVSGVGAIFSGGGTKVAETAFGAATGAIVAVGVAYLEPVATQMAAGMPLTGDEPGEELGDAAVAGYDVIANANARANGGRVLTKAELAKLNGTIAMEQKEEARAQSFAYRFFSPSNHRSIVAKLAFGLPDTWSDATSGVKTALASINPFELQPKLAWAGSVARGFSGTAIADSEEDPFGVDQYGFTDEELEQHDVLENEEWVLSRKGTVEESMKAYKDFAAKCLEPGASPVDIEGDCKTANDETTRRYRLYHFDLGLMDYITSFSNDEDDQGAGL